MLRWPSVSSRYTSARRRSVLSSDFSLGADASVRPATAKEMMATVEGTGFPAATCWNHPAGGSPCILVPLIAGGDPSGHRPDSVLQPTVLNRRCSLFGLLQTDASGCRPARQRRRRWRRLRLRRTVRSGLSDPAPLEAIPLAGGGGPDTSRLSSDTSLLSFGADASVCKRRRR